jgi:hypothetical protein
VSDPGYVSQRRAVPHGVVRADLAPPPSGPANLADILERVLDKGIVIAGDIQVNLLDIELLTIKIRLLVASVDRAKEMGINWWESDPSLSRGAVELAGENEELKVRLERLERRLALTEAGDAEDGQTRTLTEERSREMEGADGARVTESTRRRTTERRK